MITLLNEHTLNWEADTQLESLNKTTKEPEKYDKYWWGNTAAQKYSALHWKH